MAVKINLLRNIDFGLGIPICFILSVFRRAKGFFNRKENKTGNLKKIMFVQLSEIGSTILAYSAIKRAQEMYPQARFYFLISARNQDSIYMLDVVPRENVIVLRNESILTLCIDALKNLLRIRRERIDTVIDMELFSRFTTILSYLSAAGIRAGFYAFNVGSLYRGNLLTHKVAYNPYIHISMNFLNLVASLHADAEDAPLLKAPLPDRKTTVPKAKIDSGETENIWGRLKIINPRIDKDYTLVIFNPSFNDLLPLRRWPVGHYIELAKRLLMNERTAVIMIGPPLEAGDEGARQMCNAMANPRYINFVGKTTVQEVVALCHISHLFISQDSGAVNLASLTDIPLIVLFGPETPLLYEPLAAGKKIFYKHFACSPCLSAYNQRNSVCKNNACMQAITVNEVYREAMRILG